MNLLVPRRKLGKMNRFRKGFYEQILQSDIYKEYMASETSSYEEDRELWRKIYKRIVFNNEKLDAVLEDQSLYWNDDKEIVDTFVLKTIKRFDPKNGDKQELLPEFKDEEDQDFARCLFRRSILNADTIVTLSVRTLRTGIWIALL